MTSKLKHKVSCSWPTAFGNIVVVLLCYLRSSARARPIIIYEIITSKVLNKLKNIFFLSIRV